MTKRHWAALVVFLAVSVPLVVLGNAEPPVNDLSGIWSCQLWGDITDADGGRERVLQSGYLMIEQQGTHAWVFIPQLGTNLDGVVGSRYLFASQGYLGNPDGQCVVLKASIRRGRLSFTGQVWTFELHQNLGTEAMLGTLRLAAYKISEGGGPSM